MNLHYSFSFFKKTERKIKYLKTFIGAAWFHEQYAMQSTPGKRCHPFAFQIWKTENLIRTGRERNDFTVPDQMNITCAIIDEIELLHSKGICNFDKIIGDLISNNHDLYNPTLFEIKIAALYTSKGYDVKYLKPSSAENVKTPDLLINDEIEVECKYQELFSNQQTQDSKYLNELYNIVKKYCEQYNFYYCISFKTKDYLDSKTFKIIASKIKPLIKSKYIGNIEITDTVSVNMDLINEGEIIKLGDLRDILSKHGVTLSVEQDESVNNNQPYLAYDFNYQIDLDEIFVALELCSGEMKEEHHVQKPVFTSIKNEKVPNRLASLKNTIKNAKYQFSGEKPALVFISSSVITEQYLFSTYNEVIQKTVNKILENNSTLSGVFMTLPSYSNFIQLTHIATFVSDNAKNPLPEKYKIILTICYFYLHKYITKKILQKAGFKFLIIS